MLNLFSPEWHLLILKNLQICLEKKWEQEELKLVTVCSNKKEKVSKVPSLSPPGVIIEANSQAAVLAFVLDLSV